MELLKGIFLILAVAFIFSMAVASGVYSGLKMFEKDFFQHIKFISDKEKENDCEENKIQ
jgi:hypothetical protein